MEVAGLSINELRIYIPEIVRKRPSAGSICQIVSDVPRLDRGAGQQVGMRNVGEDIIEDDRPAHVTCEFYGRVLKIDERVIDDTHPGDGDAAHNIESSAHVVNNVVHESQIPYCA